MQGTSGEIRLSVNIQNFFLQATMLTGLAMLCIQQLKHQSEAVETDFFLYGYTVLLLV